MTALFYASGVVAVVAALLVVSRTNAVHALINLIVMFLAIASVFWTLGAPFAAVLEIIIYAGAIMVLFVFVVMILNLGGPAEAKERNWLTSVIWVLPVFLTAILLAQFVLVLVGSNSTRISVIIGPKPVGISLFATYLIGVELASLLLLAGLVAAFHFGVIPTRLEGEDE